MKIEILYPELTNIYGDSFNSIYLERCLPDAHVIKTSINDVPYFVNNDVDMIYIGSMPDEYQDIIIEKLMEVKKDLKRIIDNGVVFIATGTAFEIFGRYIEENGKKLRGLGIFNNYFIRDKSKINSSLFVGNFSDMKIVGNKNQFTYMYGENNMPFIVAKEGCIGSNPETLVEGIRYKNFFGTYLLGPLFVLNPYFTKYILGLIGFKKKLLFEDDLIKSYEKRLSSLERDNARYFLGDHG